MEIISKKNGWVEILAENGKKGFASKKYISNKEPESESNLPTIIFVIIFVAIYLLFPSGNKGNSKSSSSTKSKPAKPKISDSRSNKIETMAISDVQEKGNWLYVIDSNGKKSATISSSQGDLMGIGIDFIVLLKGSWYYTFDKQGKKIGTLSSSLGDFKNAAGNSFNLKKGSWIYTYDKKCKKTGTRSA